MKNGTPHKLYDSSPISDKREINDAVNCHFLPACHLIGKINAQGASGLTKNVIDSASWCLKAACLAIALLCSLFTIVDVFDVVT